MARRGIGGNITVGPAASLGENGRTNEVLAGANRGKRRMLRRPASFPDPGTTDGNMFSVSEKITAAAALAAGRIPAHMEAGRPVQADGFAA